MIEKAGGKFEGNLYSESVTMVASMESAGQVSSILYGIMIVVSNFVRKLFVERTLYFS